MKSTRWRAFALIAAFGLVCGTISSSARADPDAGSSGTSATTLASPAPVSSPPAPPPDVATPPVARVEKLPEGTEVEIQFDDRLSSATAASGDTFSISTTEPITLADGTVIPAGFRGKGEVADAEHRGMMGKAGTLNVRLTYIRIGDRRVRLRATQGEEGKSGLTTTVVLTVLFGPLGLLVHGSDVVIPKGKTLTAYVDEDADITMPVSPPPPED